MADRGHKFDGCPQEKVKTPHPPPTKRRTKTRRKGKTRCTSDSSHLKGSDIENAGDRCPKTSSNLRRGSLPSSSSTAGSTTTTSLIRTFGSGKGHVEAWVTQGPSNLSGRPGPSTLSSVRLPSLGRSDQNGSSMSMSMLSRSSHSLQGQNGDAANSQLLSKKKLPLLAAIKPYNQEVERERFFQSNFTYNPQFAYRCQLEPDALKRYSTPNAKYLDLAIHIMNTALKRYGTYEAFERRTGGRLLSKAEIHTLAREYLKKERLEEKVFINLSEDLVSRGSMTRVKGRPTLNVRVDNVREHWMDGLLRHEVGTHYIRSTNNRYQSWHSWKRRQELELGPVNPTEEGLASLHSVLFRKDPCLWRSALLYYVTFKAAFMSFADLFEDLGRFVSDPYVKWDYCLRVKRGLTDTGQPGAFCKDQVYLSGALQILKHREFIDFHALMKLGKISFKDIERLRDVGDLENTRVPDFMVNIENYRNKLEKIVKANALDDYELEKI